MKIDAPTTPVPNHILDSMADMKPSVFAVCMVVVRQTWGYTNSGDDPRDRREWDEISTSQFQKKTGMSNRAVIDAVKAAIEAGYIERRHCGLSYEYRIAPMKKVHSSDVPNCENSSQDTYEESSQGCENSSQVDEQTYENSSQEPMKKVHTQNKREIKKEDPANAGQPPPTDGNEPTPQQKYFGKVCDIVGWDSKLLTQRQRGQVAQAIGKLQDAGYTQEDLERFGPDVWVHDWRWQKKKSHPTLDQLLTEIGKLKSNKGVFTASPSSRNGSTNRYGVKEL